MAKNHSSQEKPTTKADSQNRSTTSSTTESTTTDDNSQPETPAEELQVPTRPRDQPPQTLSVDQQDLFLDLLAKGASPALACSRLSLVLSDANHTRRVDFDFAHRWQEIEQALAQNVASALYKSAIEGTVSAQTFYLKNQPPPGWEGQAKQSRLKGDNFEECTDEELVELYRALGTDLPHEIETGNASSADEENTGHVSQSDPDRE